MPILAIVITVVSIFPITVVGITSPAPIVVSVAAAHHKDLGILPNSLGWIEPSIIYKITAAIKIIPNVIVIEKNSISKESLEKIKKIGHKITERGSIGRMDCVLVNKDNSLEGGADKRGDNIALGH